ncbi:MAG TPA: hypothetical protein VNO17_03985 [Actinomycetota bacterium]|nr:hypothetical protein [Actinomycetota bacterium]
MPAPEPPEARRTRRTGARAGPILGASLAALLLSLALGGTASADPGAGVEEVVTTTGSTVGSVSDDAGRAVDRLADTVEEGLGEAEEVRSTLERATAPVVGEIAGAVRTVLDDVGEATRPVLDEVGEATRPAEQRGGDGAPRKPGSVTPGSGDVVPSNGAPHREGGSAVLPPATSLTDPWGRPSWVAAMDLGPALPWAPGLTSLPGLRIRWWPAVPGFHPGGGTAGGAAFGLLAGLAGTIVLSAPVMGRWALPPPPPLRTSLFALSVERPG